MGTKKALMMDLKTCTIAETIWSLVFSFIPYTLKRQGLALKEPDAFMTSNGYYGQGSSYYTVRLPGAFLLAVKDTTASWVGVAGELGADLIGTIENQSFAYPTNGTQTHQIFTKLVAEAGNPAVIHIWIFPGDGAGLAHTFLDDTDEDTITNTNGNPIGSFYYLRVSNFDGNDSVHPKLSEFFEMVEAFLTYPEAFNPISSVNERVLVVAKTEQKLLIS